jgi:hypothetical protein
VEEEVMKVSMIGWIRLGAMGKQVVWGVLRKKSVNFAFERQEGWLRFLTSILSWGSWMTPELVTLELWIWLLGLLII